MRFPYLLLVPLLVACGPGKGDPDSEGSSGTTGSSGEDGTTAPGHSSAPTTIPDGTDGTDGPLPTTIPNGTDGPGPTTGDGTTTAGPETTTPTMPTSASTTTEGNTTEFEGTTTADFPDTDSGRMFIVDPDPDPDPSECSPWLEDCVEGEKCMPVADGNGDTWSHFECRPVSVGATAPGTPCTVQGGPFTGLDSCQEHAMCFGVDDQLAGDCVGMCTGAPDDPACPQGRLCAQLNDGLLNLCLAKCDPLGPPCAAGDVCVPIDINFACVPADDELQPLFGGCEFLNACVAGTACLNSELAPQCDPDDLGCCLPFCALDDPECPAGLSCVAWNEEGQAPPGLELVGVCIDQP